MRIIGGEARGRPIKAPRGARTKPTTDRVREGIFSMIASRLDLDGASVLDLYAGSGALALEALSRGAARALCVDSDRGCVATIRANAAALGFADALRVSQQNALSAVGRLAAAGERFDLVLADPPYADALAPLLERLASAARDGLALLADEGLLVVEHSVRSESPARAGALERVKTRRYGDTMISLYEPCLDPANTDDLDPATSDEGDAS